MNRFVIIGIVVVAILGLFFWMGQRGKEQFDWTETYDEKSREPYGTHIAHEILRGYLPMAKLEDLTKKIAESLPTTGTGVTTANYLFVGDGFFTDTADLNKLMLFVHNGGRAFISTNAVPNYFMKRLFYTPCDSVLEDIPDNLRHQPNSHAIKHYYSPQALLNFNHPQLYENQCFNSKYFYRNEAVEHTWSYIDTLSSTLSDCTEGNSPIAPIGTLDTQKINFLKCNYGAGAVFLHTTPLAFSNIQLLDSNHVRYVEKALSHLQNGIIYWDTKSRVSSDVIENMNGNPTIDKKSPLQYILAQPALRWAWFLFLGLAAAYLIFVAKRRQRIIPVLEEKTNSSLQFIQTIGLMYFRQNEQVSVCDMKMKQFQTFVRERYKLLSRTMDDEFVKTLAMKSGISDSDVRAITLFEKRIAHNDITENIMIEFHHLLNRFYKNCK
jgi:hypothetical protein